MSPSSSAAVHLPGALSPEHHTHGEKSGCNPGGTPGNDFLFSLVRFMVQHCLPKAVLVSTATSHYPSAEAQFGCSSS